VPLDEVDLLDDRRPLLHEKAEDLAALAPLLARDDRDGVVPADVKHPGD